MMSPYAQPLIDEAKRRGIVVKTFKTKNDNAIILKNGAHTEMLYQAITDSIGAATFKFLFNKPLSLTLLKNLGYPVPQEIVTNDFEKCKKFMARHRQGIVIKPIGGTKGQGITANIKTKNELRFAFQKAQRRTRDHDKRIICQEKLLGNDYRILVINYREIFAVKREPAYIVGDGRSTIKKIIKNWNAVLPVVSRKIKISPQLKELLSGQKQTLNSRPKLGQKIILGRLANAHQGGIVTDVTKIVHPAIKKMSKQLCRDLQAPYLGIDIISTDISKKSGKIIELNPHAGTTLHLQPTFGQARDVDRAIIDMLFPETKKK